MRKRLPQLKHFLFTSTLSLALLVSPAAIGAPGGSSDGGAMTVKGELVDTYIQKNYVKLNVFDRRSGVSGQLYKAFDEAVYTIGSYFPRLYDAFMKVMERDWYQSKVPITCKRTKTPVEGRIGFDACQNPIEIVISPQMAAKKDLPFRESFVHELVRGVVIDLLDEEPGNKDFADEVVRERRIQLITNAINGFLANENARKTGEAQDKLKLALEERGFARYAYLKSNLTEQAFWEVAGHKIKDALSEAKLLFSVPAATPVTDTEMERLAQLQELLQTLVPAEILQGQAATTDRLGAIFEEAVSDRLAELEITTREVAPNLYRAPNTKLHYLDIFDFASKKPNTWASFASILVGPDAPRSAMERAAFLQAYRADAKLKALIDKGLRILELNFREKFR